MKKLLIGLLAVLSLGILTASASAATSEFLCGTGKTTSCKVGGKNLTIFVFEDMSASAAIECPAGDITTTGTVSGNEGTIETVVVAEEGAKCKPTAKALNLKEEEVTNACGEAKKFAAVDLPWLTEISEQIESTWWILHASGGKGEPGYKIVCKVAGIEVADTCTFPAGHSLLVLAGVLVEGTKVLLSIVFSATLLEAAEATTCTLGKTESGLVVGAELLLFDSGTGTEELPLEIS